MKKTARCHSILYWWIFAFLWMASVDVNAQQKQSVHISSSATIVGNVELETVRNLVLQHEPIVESLVTIHPAKDAEAGKLLARGIPNEPFRITFLSELTLRNSETGEVLEVTYRVSGFPGDEQSASEPLEAIEQELRFDENGEFYFWVGAQVDIGDVSPGNYTGKFTVELEYN